MDLVSVIVPVYKVEGFLKQCVDSLINQTYHNIEIILVDDGSPDNCPELCDEYAKKDNRIRVIHRENGGLSAARNSGINIANGEYICFVDSDDWIDLDMIELLYNAISANNADYAVCGMKDEFDYKVSQKRTGEILCKTADKNKALELILLDECFYGYAWNKLYRRAKFEDLHFDEKLLSCEDLDFTVKYAEKCESVVYTAEKMYHYRHHGLSMTGDMNYSVRKLSVLDAYEKITPIYEKHRADLLPIIERNYLKIAINILGRMKASKVDDGEVLKRIKGIIKKYYPKVMKSPIGIKTKLNIFISKNFPALILRIKQRLLKFMQRKNYA